MKKMILGIAVEALFFATPAAVLAESEISFEETLFVDEEMNIDLEYNEDCWSVTTDESHDGNAAVVGQRNGGRCNPDPYMYVTVPGRGTLSFWWKAKGGTRGSIYGREEISGGCGGYCYRVRASISSPAEFNPDTYEIIYRDSEWVHVSLDCRLDEGDEYWIDAYANEDDACLLLDEMSWTSAPDEVTIRCMTGKNAWTDAMLDPETATYANLASPTRAGYVFGGWYLDPEFGKKAEGRLPYAGSTVYAKWYRTLAAADTADMQFRNDPAAYSSADLASYGIITASEWGLVEQTYTDNSNFFSAGLPEEGSEGMWWFGSYAVMEATVTGSCFLDFVWNVTYGGASLRLFVDDEEREHTTLVSFDGANESSERLALDAGTHTLRWEADGSGAVANIRDIRKSAYTPAATLGEWFRRYRDMHCWSVNSLSSLKAKYGVEEQAVGDAGYKTSIERALSTVLALGEDKLVADTFSQFGFTLNYMNFGRAGAFDYSNAPVLNATVDQAVAKAQPEIESALADLERIPSGWTGHVLVSPNEYPVDSEVAIDYGDVLYLRALLKGALGAAHWVKAYNVEVDWAKAERDLRGPKVFAAPSAPSLTSNEGWGDPIDFLKGERSERKTLFGDKEVVKKADPGRAGQFRVARCENALYIRIPRNQFTLQNLAVPGGSMDIRIVLSNGILGGNRKHKAINLGYYSDGISLFSDDGKLQWFTLDCGTRYEPLAVQVNDADYTIAIDLTESDIGNDQSFRYVDNLRIESTMTVDQYGFWWPMESSSLEYEANNRLGTVLLDQTKAFNKIRNKAELSTSKGYVREALLLAQSADAYIIYNRNYPGDCLFNYDDADANALQVAREQLAAAIASLDAEVYVNWKKGMEKHEAELASYRNPVMLYLGALFEGRVTQSLIPESTRDDYYIPCLDTMKDPTFGGLLPDFTRAEWATYARINDILFRYVPTEYFPPVAKPEDGFLYLESDTRIDPATETAPYASAAAVYDGYLLDAEGRMIGMLQVKVSKGKVDGDTGVLGAKVTATLTLADGSKKVSFKNGVADATGAVTVLSASNGQTLALSLGVFGLGGVTGNGLMATGARNLFSGKSTEDKALASALEDAYVGTYNIVCDEGVVSVSVAKKGKAKVSGTWNGVKISANSQLLPGVGSCTVPVVINKRGLALAFNLWLQEGTAPSVSGIDCRAVGFSGTLKSGAAFRMDGAALAQALPGLYGDYLPGGLSVAQSGTKWVVAGDAKAGKLKLLKDSSEIDREKSKFTDNMSGLKLTYKAKDGSFKGSFKAYALENGKLKSYTVNVTGVMVGDTGYGEATLKKPAVSFPITVE